MRRLQLVPLSIALLAGCAGGHHDAPGPAGIPYVCADGKAARVTYAGGGYYPRASATLVYDGREIALSAVPPTYGLRYVSDPEGEGGPILIWSARGEEAWLTGLAAGESEERELAHCSRLRASGAPAEAEPAHH
jgi:membrane-bound inhibitor of C-type lysozyme